MILWQRFLIISLMQLHRQHISNGLILTLDKYYLSKLDKYYLIKLQCGIVMAIDSAKTLCHRIQLYKYITGRLNDSMAEVFNSISHAVVHTTHRNVPILTLDE